MQSGHHPPRHGRHAATLSVVALLAVLATAPAVAQVFDHEAITASPALVQGSIATGAETWRCTGNRCLTQARQAVLSVGACAKLAARAGRIQSFGPVKGKPIGAKELADCNASARLDVNGKVGGDVPPDRGRVPPPETPAPRLPTDRTLYFGDKLIVDFAGGPVALGPGDTYPFSWYCFDRVCFSNVVDRLPPVQACRDLNLKTAFRIVAVTSPRGRFLPDQIRACNKPEVVALEFVITTGRDGIRRSDLDAAGLRFLTATRAERASGVRGGYASDFYFSEGLTERTTVSRTLPVGEYHRSHALALEDLGSITLSFRSGATRTIGEQGDSFDLAALAIRAHLREMDGREYTRDIYRRDGLLQHFSDGDQWEITFSEPVFGD